MKKIKISELPIEDNSQGLWVLGTNRGNQSIRISIDTITKHVTEKIFAPTPGGSDTTRIDCISALEIMNLFT